MAKRNQNKHTEEVNTVSKSKQEKKSSFAENYGSTILGFIVVLILGSFLFNVFKGNNKNGTVGSGEETQQTDEETGVKSHVVAKGEDLWKISVKYYDSGYNWSDIAKANNIKNPDQLEEGQILTIPSVAPISPTNVEKTPIATSTPVENTKTQESITITITPQPTKTDTQSVQYIVKKGDNLWKVAVSQYNDGYKWVEIAKANKLINPNIIHVGNTLSIPR
jgi:nucleoid-associated protein YgaU